LNCKKKKEIQQKKYIVHQSQKETNIYWKKNRKRRIQKK